MDKSDVRKRKIPPFGGIFFRSSLRNDQQARPILMAALLLTLLVRLLAWVLLLLAGLVTTALLLLTWLLARGLALLTGVLVRVVLVAHKASPLLNMKATIRPAFGC